MLTLLIPLNQQIYTDTLNENRKSYKIHAQSLSQLNCQFVEDVETRHLLSICYYNLGKLSGKSKFTKMGLFYADNQKIKTKWNLQLLALQSSTGNHQEAYNDSCILMDTILSIIKQIMEQKQQKYQLSAENQMFAVQVIKIVQRQKSNVKKTMNELQLSRKIQTNCKYITKQFHIADIMIMEPINPKSQFQKEQQNQSFFEYIIFLSICCFIRATEKFYCRDSSEKQYHFRALEIASYLYEDKSTYVRFLKRTYNQHYFLHLEDINQVQCENYGGKVKLLKDQDEVKMTKMPYEQQFQFM